MGKWEWENGEWENGKMGNGRIKENRIGEVWDGGGEWWSEENWILVRQSTHRFGYDQELDTDTPLPDSCLAPTPHLYTLPLYQYR